MKDGKSLRLPLAGLLATVGVILLVYRMRVPNPNVILLTLVVFFTELGGGVSGSVCAVPVIVYSLFFFSVPGAPFQYTAVNFQKVLVTAVFLPVCVALVDILRRKRRKESEALAGANRELERLARTDPLTGVPNRRSFDEVLRRMYAENAVWPGGLCCALADIDFFKQYNDHYGHLAGDECLRRLAQAMEREALRTGGFVARVGGEEFGVLFPDCDVKEAESVCGAIARAVQDLCIEHAYSPAASVVTVSIGLSAMSVREDPDADAYRLMSGADRALYQAKRNGRNRVEVCGNGEECPPPRRDERRACRL